MYVSNDIISSNHVTHKNEHIKGLVVSIFRNRSFMKTYLTWLLCMLAVKYEGSRVHRSWINKYISTKKIWTAKNLIDVMINVIFTQFDRSKSIINDKKILFTFNFWSAFCYHLWMRLNYSTAYHFQTNEQIKKQNQTLEIYLKCYVNYEQNDWIK